MSEQQSQPEEAGREYPGNLSRWRELHNAGTDPQDAIDPNTVAVARAIEKGFEGLALVLTQIRFDMKGRS